jgi:hypothetical protein
MSEFGVFNSEGCWYGPVSREDAEERQKSFFLEDPDQDSHEAVVKELCPYHSDESREDCDRCWAEDFDDE